ncbi:hypothetical protein [Cohaesibacter gelatinilyticus]|uniref:Cysteine rich repeat-containing protein n=1 Tax=Cohaesibacter gelatinilyticus TaxID=372072 RepID=A0A285PDZ8_9HYPH|nr:hypothetical protein [Cohaesibacter gelatinilyticus]SNZ19955.1 hypothetical protein SAMN06265368_3051 [Cohaesibacter gelatinilyticus]HAT85979.1 hypothetical protein [Hyphomicrobiales bacterium]
MTQITHMSTIKAHTFALAAFGLLALSSPGQTATFESAYAGFCEKMKSCAMAEINKVQGMNEAMKTQATMMIEGMCANVRQDFTSITQHPALEPAAVDCLNSMAALSCEDLSGHQGAQTTPQCTALQTKAEAMGAKFGQ